MIFGNQIYGHLYILMFQNGPAKKVEGFRAVLKKCYGSILLGLEPQKPLKHVSVPPVSMSTTQTSPRYPPNTLQTTPGNSRYQQTTTDDIRHLQTPSDTDRCCLSMPDTQP